MTREGKQLLSTRAGGDDVVLDECYGDQRPESEGHPEVRQRGNLAETHARELRVLACDVQLSSAYCDPREVGTGDCLTVDALMGRKPATNPSGLGGATQLAADPSGGARCALRSGSRGRGLMLRRLPVLIQ